MKMVPHLGLLVEEGLAPHCHSGAQIISISSVHPSLGPQSAPLHPLHPAQQGREDCVHRGHQDRFYGPDLKAHHLC